MINFLLHGFGESHVLLQLQRIVTQSSGNAHRNSHHQLGPHFGIVLEQLQHALARQNHAVQVRGGGA